MESNDDVTFCATVDFFFPIVVFAFINTFVDEAAKTGGGRRREGTAAADDDATTREDLLLPEEAVIFSLSFKIVSNSSWSFFCADFEKFSQRSRVFFCFVRNEVLVCVCMYVNLDFKRVNVEYARGTLNY
jgi:hypothetical protein